MHDRHLPRLALLVVVAALPMLPAVAAQDAQEGETPRVLHLEALNVGEEYWFKVKGTTTENPELGFRPGDTVEIHLDSKGHVAHNLRVGPPIGEALPLLAPGESDVLRFTVPSEAAGGTRYWCEPHKEFGMNGTVRFGERKEGPGLEIPGPSLPGLLLAVALMTYLFGARRR